MAAELEAFGEHVTPRMIPGDRGVFDVKVDGELVFSKKMRHRFPDPGEIVEIVKRRMAP